MITLPITFRSVRRCATSFAGALLLTLSASISHATPTPGSQDSTFAVGTQSDSTILAMALQANGQVVVGGLFTQFRGSDRNAVARLNANGTLDTFNPGLAISAYSGSTPVVAALAVQPVDQKIIVGGIFNVLNQTPGGGVARLNPDGSLDAAFNVGSGVVDDGDSVGQVYALAITADNQILVGGSFQTFNGVAVAGLVRLNALDGSVDTTFNPGGAGITANSYGGSVNSIVVESTGQIVIGGYFSAYNGMPEGCVARLNADGTLDTTFKSGTGADEGVTAVAVQTGGKVLVGGGYNDFDGFDDGTHLVRLNTDGTLDTGYDPVLSNLFSSGIDCIIAQPDGTVLIGGTLLASGGLVNGPHNGVARLLANGEQDTTFDSGTSDTDYEARALVLQPDGKVLEAVDIGAGYSYPSNVIRLYDLTTAAKPTVTVVAGVALTDENSGAPATFIVKLSAVQASSVVVHYTVQGTAKPGYNYKKLTGAVTIPAGKKSKVIDVTAINHQIKSDAKLTVKLTLESNASYKLGSPKGATVKVIENK